MRQLLSSRLITITGLIAAGVFLALASWWAAASLSATPTDMLMRFPQGAYICELVRDHSVNFVMPLPPCLAYWSAGLPAAYAAIPAAALLFMILLLLATSGIALGSPVAGALAPAVFAFYAICRSGQMLWPANYLESLAYALTCTAIAYALILRSETPHRKYSRELLLAALIGTSFMIKSPLVLLPPLLAAWDLFNGKLARKETGWLKLLLLLLVPYLMLLPWAAMNWRVFERFLLLENGRSAQNLISGAMGVVYTVEGAYPMAGLPPETPVSLWAAKTVLTHPLAYLSSVLARLYTFFTWHPNICTAFVLACVRFRKFEKFTGPALFAGYFIGMHSLLSIEPRYFFPIYPVLALCAATLPEPSHNPGSGFSRTSKLIVAAIIALLLAAYLLMTTVLLRFTTQAMPLTRAVLSRHAKHPLLLSQAAQQLTQTGNLAAARALAEEALLKHPCHSTAREYLYVLIASGQDISGLFKQKILDCGNSGEDCAALQCANALEQGRNVQSAAYFNQAIQIWGGGALSFKAISSPHELALYRKQQERGFNAGREKMMKSIAEHLTPGQARRLRMNMAEN